jgi:hypothetical protein
LDVSACAWKEKGVRKGGEGRKERERKSYIYNSHNPLQNHHHIRLPRPPGLIRRVIFPEIEMSGRSARRRGFARRRRYGCWTGGGGEDGLDEALEEIGDNEVGRLQIFFVCSEEGCGNRVGFRCAPGCKRGGVADEGEEGCV